MGRWPLYRFLHTAPLVSSAFSGSNPQWRILQTSANCCKKKLQSWELFLDHHNGLSPWVKALPGSTFHGTKQFSPVSMVLYKHTNIMSLLEIFLKMLLQNLHRELLQEKRASLHCSLPSKSSGAMWYLQYGSLCGYQTITGNSADTSLCQDLRG